MEKLNGIKAMIFAAGLGTRLRPLTNDRPKALVEINGQTLLEWCIKRLKFFGITEVVVNIHHFAELMHQFLDDHQDFGITIHRSDESDTLLETGGGLLKAKPFFEHYSGPILICNVDILSDLDLNQFVSYHQSKNHLATLAMRQRETSRYLHFNDNNQLSAWENVKTGEVKRARPESQKSTRLAFSGIQVIESEFLNLIKQTGKFSIIDTYLDLAKTQTIGAYDHTAGQWLDVGKPQALKQAPILLESFQS